MQFDQLKRRELGPFRTTAATGPVPLFSALENNCAAARLSPGSCGAAPTRPPRRRSSRPRSQAPRGALDCSRQLDASRSSAPNGHPPHHPWGCAGFSLDARRGRDRITLVIPTTERHAALPEQGSARPVGLAAVRIHDADLYGRAFSP